MNDHKITWSPCFDNHKRPRYRSGETQNHYQPAVDAGHDAARLVSSTRIAYISGQVGWVKDMPNDFESQVNREFANLSAALEAAGSRNADVVKITLLIKDHPS